MHTINTLILLTQNFLLCTASLGNLQILVEINIICQQVKKSGLKSPEILSLDGKCFSPLNILFFSDDLSAYCMNTITTSLTQRARNKKANMTHNSGWPERTTWGGRCIGMDIDVCSVLYKYIHTYIHIYAFLEKWIMLCMMFHNLTFHLS